VGGSHPRLLAACACCLLVLVTCSLAQGNKKLAGGNPSRL